ncbi:MAG TPA: E3 binding domain-containing protein, partial [Anaerovoracaceae bacterium]|nr:E3 binding domain-containing protein [Anaerovoracaceae bacterium]
MTEIIVMPKLGFNMSEGKLVKWYKNEGDAVKKGDLMFAIETDKTAIDIEATMNGIFRKKFIEEGDSIEVTLPIAIIANENENIDALIQEVNRQLNRENPAESFSLAAESKPEEVPSSASLGQMKNDLWLASTDKMLKITPRAKRAAIENGLDLKGIVIEGTGYQGGISEKDILAYLVNNKLKVSPIAQKMAEVQGIPIEDIHGTGINGKIIRRDVEKQPISSAVTNIAGAKTDISSALVTKDGKEILE